jgi:hypothetical protein
MRVGLGAGVPGPAPLVPLVWHGPGGAARRKEAAAVKSLVIKLPKKLSREAAVRLGSERVAPGQAVPLHPEAVAFAGHYGFELTSWPPTGPPGRAGSGGRI